MDKGRPFRVSQSTDRRAVRRPDRVRQQQPEEPAPERAKPQPVAADSGGQTSSKKRLPFFVGKIIIAGLLVAVLAWFAWMGIQNNRSAIDSDKYQAVFFTNGQVYFGKLHEFNSNYMRLTNVYYLQNQQPQAEGADTSDDENDSSGQGEVQLIKLGDEIHGPEDEMVISKEQILFYENLKPDGGVARSITEHQSNN